MARSLGRRDHRSWHEAPRAARPTSTMPEGYCGMVDAADALIRPDRYPLSSRYDPRWLLGLDMGPHPLWQLENIFPALALRPMMRVLDLGCGYGATSVFLARECGVTVTACDLWIDQHGVEEVVRAAGLAASITAVRSDVRQLPFPDDTF